MEYIFQDVEYILEVPMIFVEAGHFLETPEDFPHDLSFPANFYHRKHAPTPFSKCQTNEKHRVCCKCPSLHVSKKHVIATKHEVSSRNALSTQNGLASAFVRGCNRSKLRFCHIMGFMG